MCFLVHAKIVRTFKSKVETFSSRTEKVYKFPTFVWSYFPYFALLIIWVGFFSMQIVHYMTSRVYELVEFGVLSWFLKGQLVWAG